MFFQVKGHSRSSSSSREFREKTKQDALNNLNKELNKLADMAPPAQRELVHKEMQGFSDLFERFLAEEGPSVQWDRMEKLPDGAVRNYQTLEVPTTDLVHQMLQKLVVVKLNGGLGTSMIRLGLHLRIVTGIEFGVGIVQRNSVELGLSTKGTAATIAITLFLLLELRSDDHLYGQFIFKHCL